MKLKQLQTLPILSEIKPLQTQNQKKAEYLSTIEFLLYTADLCLFSTLLLRNEITIKNKDFILANITNEIKVLDNILKEDNLSKQISIKHKKDFLKKVGLKPKHLRN